MNVLYPKFALNKYIALFIIPVLKQAGEKYAFIDKWKKEDMEKDCILLPVDDNHQPDFSYMESYMKNREITISEALTKLQSAKRFLKSRNAEFESWKTYRIKDIFPNIVKPGSITPARSRKIPQESPMSSEANLTTALNTMLSVRTVMLTLQK